MERLGNYIGAKRAGKHGSPCLQKGRARRTVARTVNSILAATYWEIGRRIVEFDEGARRGPSMGRPCWFVCPLI